MPFWNNPTTFLPKQAHRWVIEFATDVGESRTDNPSIPFASQIKENKISKYFAKSCDRPSYEIGVQEAKYLYSHTFKFPKRVTWKPITIVFYDTLIRNYKIDKNRDILKSQNNIDLKKKPDGTAYEKNEFTPKPAGNGVYGSGHLISPHGRSATQEDAIQTTEQEAQNKTKYIKSTKIGTAPSYGLSTESSDATNSSQLFFFNFLQTIGYVPPNNQAVTDSAVFRLFNFKDQIKEAITKINIKELDEEANTIEQWQLANPIISSVVFDKLDYASEDILKITVTVHYDWAQLIPMPYPTGDRRVLDGININVGADYMEPEIVADTPDRAHTSIIIKDAVPKPAAALDTAAIVQEVGSEEFDDTKTALGSKPVPAPSAAPAATPPPAPAPAPPPAPKPLPELPLPE